jgi:hypothetical protein
MSTLLPDRTSHAWWRHRGRWLLGALLLAAWALYMPYHEWREQDQRMRPTRPLTVAAGAWARYEGARWRLLEVAPGTTSMRRRPGTYLLVARFELIADAGTSAKSLDACKSRMSDAQGRYWETSSVGGISVHGVRSKLPTSCGSGLTEHFQQIEPVPGKPWQFTQTFEIPNTVDAGSLHPEILILWPKQSPRGQYLRFSR